MTGGKLVVPKLFTGGDEHALETILRTNSARIELTQRQRSALEASAGRFEARDVRLQVWHFQSATLALRNQNNLFLLGNRSGRPSGLQLAFCGPQLAAFCGPLVQRPNGRQPKFGTRSHRQPLATSFNIGINNILLSIKSN